MFLEGKRQLKEIAWWIYDKDYDSHLQGIALEKHSMLGIDRGFSCIKIFISPVQSGNWPPSYSSVVIVTWEGYLS